MGHRRVCTVIVRTVSATGRSLHAERERVDVVVQRYGDADTTAADAEEKTKTLYERLGGYDGISAVVDEFAGRLFKEPKISQFFAGMSDDSKESFDKRTRTFS